MINLFTTVFMDDYSNPNLDSKRSYLLVARQWSEKFKRSMPVIRATSLKKLVVLGRKHSS
jgi:hypothetical protein